MYSDSPTLAFDFTVHDNAQSLIGAIRNISLQRGSTATGLALRFAAERLFVSRGLAIEGDDSGDGDGEDLSLLVGYRGNGVALVVTDGNTQESEAVLSRYATQLKGTGVEVFALGIGPRNTRDQLEIIASIPANVDQVRDFNGLAAQSLIQPLHRDLFCGGEDFTTPDPTTTKPSVSTTDEPTTTEGELPPCEFGAIDLAFVFDASDSVGTRNWALLLQFASNLVKKVNASPAEIKR